ncbi:hypothetical protein ACIRRA_40525 [Nocardia sp. NPDC101769]|uniref:hypothetical protein n=1 Tax=Nocardia sp. NPDC101769 TaxID=3364333 RepID=UPI00380E639E
MGLGFVTIAAVGETHADITGLASGFATTTQQLGGALGLGVLTTVAIHHRTTRLAAGASPSEALSQGFQLTYLVSAGILTLAALLVAVGITATAGAARPDLVPVA